MEADTITLALTVGVVLLIAKCFWTSDEADGGETGRRQPQRGDRAATSAAPGPRKPLSPAAQSLQKELGVTFGRAVTISTLGVILTRPGAGQPLALINEAVEVVRALVEFADVFLITEVADEAESAAVMQVLKQTGCIPEQGGGAGIGIAQHKVLFCSTAIGRQAIVRQLKPQLHVDQDDGLLSKLVPYISRLLRIDATFEGKPDSLPYRLLPSLQALLPKLEEKERGASKSSD